MRRLLTSICFAVALAMSLPAFAIELSGDETNIPSDYATVQDGKVAYNNAMKAYTGATFNGILTSYGLELTPEAVAGVSSSYAKVVDGKVVFGKTRIAYTPADYHKIFTAYGLELTPDDAAAMLGALDYAEVVDGKIVFGKTSTAYSNLSLSQILAAYSLPAMAVVAVVETDCIDSDGDTVCDEIDVCVSTPKGVKVDERGCWLLEQTYLFDFDKAEVKPEFFALFDSVAEVMTNNPTMKLQLEGHTDSVGTVGYNLSLSERRAMAIKNGLIEKNMIAADRIKAVGFGEDKPITGNDTAEGRAKNRRVELTPVW